MEKINIAKLLENCPKGMELDCTEYDGFVKFDGFNKNNPYTIRIIVFHDGCVNIHNLTEYGQTSISSYNKCVIFPKGKTTWEGFHRPFKDGDILATDLGSVFYLNTRLNNDEYYGCYVGIGSSGSFHICEPFAYKECCGFATEKEKEKLFKAIKDNGYKWNPETKTLEKIIQPKFKVGDKVVHKNNHNVIFTITNIENDYYICRAKKMAFGFHDQDHYELVNEPKFNDGDIITDNRGNICIYKGPMSYNKNLIGFYCGYRITDNAFIFKHLEYKHFGDINEYRFATEEEKSKLFQIIKQNDYKWNSETKTLEKLIIPKFKVGDKIKYKHGVEQGVILSITDNAYDIAVTNNIGISVRIIDQDEWELIPNKFDITTLKPFESKVLVRDYDTDVWQPTMWGIYDKGHRFPYVTIGCRYRQCIPYRGNEYLLSKTESCKDFYKIWE